MTQNSTELNTPWSLHFDRDGTEDFGIICDAKGNDLVASHLPNRMPPRWANRGFGEGCFWLPEEDEEIPLLVRQMRLMTAAPKLLAALEALSGLEVKGHPLLARLQFSEEGRKLAAQITGAIAEAKGLAAWR